MAEYKVEPHLPSSQTTQAPGGSIIIMLPTKAVVGFLATLAIAKAAKLNEDSLYHVVEDWPANETVKRMWQPAPTSWPGTVWFLC